MIIILVSNKIYNDDDNISMMPTIILMMMMMMSLLLLTIVYRSRGGQWWWIFSEPLSSLRGKYPPLLTTQRRVTVLVYTIQITKELANLLQYAWKLKCFYHNQQQYRNLIGQFVDVGCSRLCVTQWLISSLTNVMTNIFVDKSIDHARLLSTC